MQLRLISWFFIALNFMEYIGSQHASRVRRQGRRRYVPATSMRASIQGCVLNFNQAFKSNRSQGVCVTYVKVAAEGQADKMSSDMEVPMEQRRGTEFLYAGKMPPIGIHQCLLNVSGDPTANVNTVRQWVVHIITDSGSPLLVQIVTSMTLHPNVSQGCQGGCATCSDYNGCLSCKPRLFFVLERIGMKQIGVCLSSCPSGYYGTRYPDINKCAKCKADCDTCFTRNFCTKCKSGFYLYSGKCLEKCPDGLEANNHTMECTSIVHCEASEWSPWSPCTKKGKTCGFKRGNEVRVREIVQHPSARGNPCPATSESRKCMVQRKRCQKEGKGKKNREEKRKKSNKDESKESKQESKGRAARRQNREQRENNNKTQPKKRKAPSKEQNLAPVDTAH